MNNIINVCYPVDNTNWQNCLVSIISLATNNSNNKVNIFCLEEKLSDNIKENFKKVNNQFVNITIKMITISSKAFDKLSFKGSQCRNSWFRLLFPSLCPQVDKVIFLSGCPTIVMNDLGELYNTDLENYYIAATLDIFENVNEIKKYKLSIDIYRNINIMLMNCKKMREDNVLAQFENIIKKQNNFDLYDFANCLNYVLGNKIKDLDNRYNYQEPWFTNNYDKNIINTKEYKLAKQTPIIIDFIGLAPHYSNCYHSKKEIWWRYAKKAPFEIKEQQSYYLQATSAQNSFKYSWLLSRIFPYIKPYIPRIVIGFLIAIPLGLLDGVTALALKPYMDYVIGGKALEFFFIGHDISISSLAMAFLLPAGVILFAIIQGVLKYLNDYISAWTSQRITNDVKFDLFHRLIHMHPQFFDDNSSGIVISRYMGDPATASSGIVDQIKTITTSLCGALGLIGVMVYSSWKLAFIGVLVLCIAFIPVALIRKRIKETSNKNMVIGGNITTNINETYSGNKVMAAYDLQDRQENYFKNQVWKSFNINMSLTKRAAWMSPLMYLIASFGIAIVLGYGTYLINTGHMTAGSFASFVTSLLLLYKPVKTLGGTLTGIQNIFVAMGRVFELFDLTPAIKDCENPKTLNGFENSIEFKDVCFEYVPNQPVLKNINLTIPKNETLAIVGNSGGGKSTLVNLIPRFYDIKSGSIKIDGTDIHEFSLKSLRNNISMVFQDNFLYTGTIKDNIMMGNPDASTEELMEAIKSAHLQDMIAELPEGLETELGERGLTLSGGQRQRVAIARAMLRNAPIVILDEATSALDNQSEAIVQKAMDNLMQNRTVFIIAHRLSTIKNADRIAVINEGELVEIGNHEELMQIENGEYKHLYEMQFRIQEII